jgi:molecular chaperone DnaK
VLVYDLGGSFDASLIEINSGVFEVIAINGDMDLGGREWDAEIVDWLCEQIEREHGVTVRDSPATTKRLFDVARETKHDLSSDQKAQIDLSFSEVGTGTVDIEQTLSRTTFKQLTHTLTEDTIDICEELFAGGQYGPQTVDKVILVGGATRIAQVQDRVTDYFGLKPSQRDNPDEAVALGAATQAAVINR